MRLEKITEAFTLYEAEGNYILDLGNFKKGAETKTKIRISEIDSDNFTLVAKCGCTATNLQIVDKTTVEADIIYNNCETSFSKTVELIQNKRKLKELKIKGKCQLA